MILSRRETLITGAKAVAALSASSLGLTSCGGGGGGGDGDDVIISPRSLDNLTFNFFNAFTLRFLRLSGQRDREFGAIQYSQTSGSFLVGISSGGGTIADNVQIPSVMTDMRYIYEVTSPNTARITISWGDNPEQAYPFSPPTMMNPLVRGQEMFFTDGTGPTQISVDMLFQNASGFLSDRIARINGYISLVWTLASKSKTLIEFDSPDVITIRNSTGGQVPSGYDPYIQIDDSTVSRAVWSSLDHRVVDYFDALREVRIARVSFLASSRNVNTGLETGDMLISSPAEGVVNVGGTYTYRPTGGDRALLTLRYPTITQVVDKRWDMDFDSLEAGVWVDSANMQTGLFDQDLSTTI